MTDVYGYSPLPEFEPWRHDTWNFSNLGGEAIRFLHSYESFLCEQEKTSLAFLLEEFPEAKAWPSSDDVSILAIRWELLFLVSPDFCRNSLAYRAGWLNPFLSSLDIQDSRILLERSKDHLTVVKDSESVLYNGIPTHDLLIDQMNTDFGAKFASRFIMLGEPQLTLTSIEHFGKQLLTPGTDTPDEYWERFQEIILPAMLLAYTRVLTGPEESGTLLDLISGYIDVFKELMNRMHRLSINEVRAFESLNPLLWDNQLSLENSNREGSIFSDLGIRRASVAAEARDRFEKTLSA